MRYTVRPQPFEIRELHAQVCQALADPTRIMILYVLSEESRNVSELVKALELSQSLISRHLKVLRERGMVNTERQGANIVYSLADERIIQALDLMRGMLAEQLARKGQLAKGLA